MGELTTDFSGRSPKQLVTDYHRLIFSFFKETPFLVIQRSIATKDLGYIHVDVLEILRFVSLRSE